jgi:hypothetical protein
MNSESQEMKSKLEQFGMDYYKRQTGRTTRMFEAAKAAAQSGKPVTVLMKDQARVNDWCTRGWEVPGLEIIGLKAKEDRIDWQNLKMKDHRANNQLFIDHDVFYSQFKDILREFTKYDAPVKDVPQHVINAVFPDKVPAQVNNPSLKELYNEASEITCKEKTEKMVRVGIIAMLEPTYSSIPAFIADILVNDITNAIMERYQAAQSTLKHTTV